MDLICPKCRGAMRTYERSGITVDQCSECRGIFLDRGELEKLVDAENSFHGAAPAPSAPSVPAAPAAPAYGSPQPRYDPEYRDRDRERDYRDSERGRRDDDDHYRRPRYDDDYRRSGSGDYSKKKRKKSLFEELFD